MIVLAHLTDVDAACERLIQFQRVLADCKSDAVEAERQLRLRIGLPESDNRQIIPIEQPITEQVVFDRDACLEAMMQNQPDIVQQDDLTNRAEQKLAQARKIIVEAAKKREIRPDGGVGRTYMGFATPAAGRPVLANVRQLHYTLLRAREFQDQVVQQSTRSLSRAVDSASSAYELYVTARSLRIAAESGLENQQMCYDEGCITADRYLDAVEQYATLVANEHHCLAAYHSALTFVSECKGTLLEDRDIVVAERSRVGGAKGLGDDIPDNVFAKRGDR